MAKPGSAGSAVTSNYQVSPKRSILELFSPKESLISLEPVPSDNRLHSSLWHEEALHRANNISQKFAALERIAPSYAEGEKRDVLQRQATELAAAYAKLGADNDLMTVVPCKKLLRQIASGLVSLLANPPGIIELHLVTDQVMLPQDQRRALLLIASELVINSIKYAFSSRTRGKITVSLMADGQWTSLTVQDDGIGLGSADGNGEGNQIIARLCALLGASLNRVSRRGRGLCTQIIFKNEIVI